MRWCSLASVSPGIAIVSGFLPVPQIADFAIIGLAMTGSLMNTFIKPVVYAEIGYREKVEGKIDDPLEGVGFFGRPETFLVLILGGVTGFIWDIGYYYRDLHEPLGDPEDRVPLQNTLVRHGGCCPHI